MTFYLVWDTLEKKYVGYQPRFRQKESRPRVYVALNDAKGAIRGWGFSSESYEIHEFHSEFVRVVKENV